MGVDPGTNILGYGVINIEDDRTSSLVDLGVIDLRKEKDHFKKLAMIFSETGALYDKFKPDFLAVESPFYGKNVQVTLKLGRAQGAAITAACARGIPVFEYAPRKAKIAITGRGDASKEQVCMMIKKILNADFNESFLDATDALAIAMCHYFQMTNPIQSSGTADSWKKFLDENPDRIKKF